MSLRCVGEGIFYVFNRCNEITAFLRQVFIRTHFGYWLLSTTVFLIFSAMVLKCTVSHAVLDILYSRVE